MEETLEKANSIISTKTRSTLTELFKMWQELGLDQDQIEARLDRFTKEHLIVYKGMLEEEQTYRKDLKKSLQELLDDISLLRRRLDLESYTNEGSSESLLYQKAKLEDEKSHLIECCSSKISCYNDLLRKEKDLCELLGYVSAYEELPEGDVPKDTTTEALRERIVDLEGWKNKAMVQIRSYHDSAIELSGQLELNKEETHVILEVKDLSERGIENISNWIDQKKKRLEENTLEILSLKARLELLWDCFEIDRPSRYAFLQSYRHFGSPTIRAFSEEIETYRRKKLENASQFLSLLDKEVQTYWDKCCVSENERIRFRTDIENTSTEVSLDRYEDEAARWKNYYLSNAALLEMLSEREQLLNKVKILDVKASDPSRFKNRGGHLLKEEKEWKRVTRELPKLERTLLDQVKVYTKETGLEFLAYGTPIHEYLSATSMSSWSQKAAKQTKNLKLNVDGTFTSATSACSSHTDT